MMLAEVAILNAALNVALLQKLQQLFHCLHIKIILTHLTKSSTVAMNYTLFHRKLPFSIHMVSNTP